MADQSINSSFLDELLVKIQQGLIAGVRQEVRRRREAGLPLHIERDGRIVTITPSDPLPPQHT